jgi:hypothetical protein
VNDEQFAAEVKRTVYRLQALCSEAVQRNVKIELSVSNIGLVKQFIPHNWIDVKIAKVL